MFEVEYKGANNVIFTTKMIKIAFDPALSLVGLKDNLGVQDVEILSEGRFAASNVVPRLLFSGPGEYEIGEVSILGVPVMNNTKTIYDVSVSGVRIGILGDVEEGLDDIGVSDILCTSSVRAIREIGPKLIVATGNVDGMVAELKLSARTEKKLKIKRVEDLPTTQEVVVLN